VRWEREIVGMEGKRTRAGGYEAKLRRGGHILKNRSRKLEKRGGGGKKIG